MAPAAIKIHHLEYSRSERLFWILEELGQPYDVQVHFRTAAGFAEPSLKAVPLGKAPAAEVNGEVLIESGAILAALMTAYGQHAGPGFEKQISAKSNFWSVFSEGTFMMALQPTVVAARVSTQLKKTLDDEAEKRGVDKMRKALFEVARRNVNGALELVEQWLETHENFTGNSDFGVGDVMMHFHLWAAYAGGKGPYKYGPKTVEWLQRVAKRPAFQRAVARREREEKEAKAAKAQAKL